jgi:intraflagellar transport protein 122
VGEFMDVATLLMRGKPFHDRDELLIVCPRCGQTNPPLPATTAAGDRCAHCSLPFVRCWATFQVLPLVEFKLDAALRDAEAEAILSGLSGAADQIQSSASASDYGRAGGLSGMQQQQPQQQNKREQREAAAADVLTFNNDDFIDAALDDGDGGGRNLNIDPFSRQMLALEMTRAELGAAASSGSSSSAATRHHKYNAVTVNAAQLRKLPKDDVFVAHRGWGLPNAYFRNMDPRVAVTICHGCNKFFRVEDFEFACMKRSGACPFCRTRRNEAASSAQKRKRYRASAAAAAASGAKN